MKNPFTIVFPIYEGLDLMDLAAPKEIFSWLQNKSPEEQIINIYTVSYRKETITTRDGLKIIPDKGFKDPEVQSPNLIWVPGASIAALEEILGNENHPLIAYIKIAGEHADWVCSVCEGALPLAKSGLLDGYEATTHWAFINCLKRFKDVTVVPGYPRYVRSGNRITGGGISSGIDEALYVVELLAGTAMAQEVQMTLQYYPDPPVMRPLPTESPSCPVKW